MVSKATAAQIRKIYILAKEQGMDNDLLHLYVDTLVKKKNLSKLSITDAVKVIDGLSGKKRAKDTEEHATKKQIWKIKEQARLLGWVNGNGENDEDRLNGFLRERFGVEHYKWLTKKKASDVIEAFKQMLERQKEECRDGKDI